MSSQQSEKRGPGRPRSGRKPRLDITLSQEAIDFINWRIGEDGNLSGYLDMLVKQQPDYEVWEHGVKHP